MSDNNQSLNNSSSYRITTTLSIEQHQHLSQIAEKNKVSMAWLIRRAIDKFLEELDGNPRLPFGDR